MKNKQKSDKITKGITLLGMVFLIYFSASFHLLTETILGLFYFGMVFAISLIIFAETWKNYEK